MTGGPLFSSVGVGGRAWARVGVHNCTDFQWMPVRAAKRRASSRVGGPRAGNLRSSARGTGCNAVLHGGPVAPQFCTGQAEGAKQIDTGQVRTVAGRGRVLAGIVTGAI